MAKQEEKPDMKAVMEAYKEIGTSGAPHKLLANLEGSWITKTRSWMEPGKPPLEETGVCEQKVLLGGRYVQQEYSGDMMGQPFKGISILGYDNQTKKYVSTWIDSMSTGIFLFVGTASADGKTITQEANHIDPVRGPMTSRSVTRIKDDNTVEFEMFMIPKGGKEEKAMEMTMTRKEARARKAA